MSTTLLLILLLLPLATVTGDRDGRPPEPSVVDLRGIWDGTTLEPKGAAKRGLNVADIEPPRIIWDFMPAHLPNALFPSMVTIKVECTIDIVGLPRGCRLTQAAPVPALDDWAMAGVSNGRFFPLKVRGEPRPALVEFEVPIVGYQQSHGRVTRTAIAIPVPSPSQPLDLLIASLSSADAKVRARAASELAGANERQSEIRSLLTSLLIDSNQAVRYSAAWSLAHLRSPPGAESVTAAWTPPKPIGIIRPSYPTRAHNAGIQGTVLLELLIGERGEVAHAGVQMSIPELDAAALECVQQWRFEPAQLDGNPRPIVILAPVTFRIH